MTLTLHKKYVKDDLPVITMKDRGSKKQSSISLEAGVAQQDANCADGNNLKM